mmetsp:Transcript_36689/g.57616  ORF Transcript_36689/g.57616 Transcript_36689/m.57616 type:complete len:306 (-) Transcript_36689:34-951(-)
MAFVGLASSRSLCRLAQTSRSLRLFGTEAGPAPVVVPTVTGVKETVDESGETIKERVARTAPIKARKKTPRWYQTTNIVQHRGKYEVELDGRRLQTPGDARLRVPTSTLAHGIAFEWLRQPNKIRPSTMPMMQYSCTAIDRLPITRTQVIESLLEHLHTDTACCRADPNQQTEELVQKEKEVFDPLVRWFCERYNVHLEVMKARTLNIEQPQDTITVLQWEFHNLDDWTLAGLDVLVQCTRSTVLTMAIYEGRITVSEGLTASRLEESTQHDSWGYVEGAHDIAQADLNLRMYGAAMYLHALRQQ